MKTRIALLVILIACAELAQALLGQTADPQIRTALALRSVNGDAASTVAVRSYETIRPWARVASISFYLIAAVLLLSPSRKGQPETKTEKT